MMSTEAIVGLTSIGVTLGLFFLGIVCAVIGWFLARHMTKVEKQLASLPRIEMQLAILSTTQAHHSERIDEQCERLSAVEATVLKFSRPSPGPAARG